MLGVSALRFKKIRWRFSLALATAAESKGSPAVQLGAWETTCGHSGATPKTPCRNRSAGILLTDVKTEFGV